MHGTKAMCHEGGCGACVVSVAVSHPGTKEKQEFAVNSCLVHVLSCHRWDITTIEGVGNRKDGYHPIQSRLAAFNGTQCGYCTPGWVMNMYSLSKKKDKLTMKDVERSFGGNICRCTGYRPILDAFKSFATDVSDGLKEKLQDLEDLDKTKCKSKCEGKCSVEDEWSFIEKEEETLLNVGGLNRWFKVYSIQDVFNVLSKEGSDSYRLVAGNTGKGVYPNTKEPRIYIDISSVSSLRDTFKDENLIIGAGMSLTELMKTCQNRSSANQDFSYLKQFWKHLDLVAHVPVRNIGTIGGNLALKNSQHEFPSDLFLLFETVGAFVTIVDSKLKKTRMNMEDFLKTDLANKLIINVMLPPLSERNLMKTYKVMARAQNTHAIVNAGFLFKVKNNNIVETSNIVFGNIAPSFVHASDTENMLVGQELFKEETLRAALMKLKQELVPEDSPPEPSGECRKNLALGLFYKAILSLCPSVSPRYKSGGTVLTRRVSVGTQTYDTDKSLWPLNQPVVKLEALSQCSGEARYSCDRYSMPRDVHVAFVLSDICLGEIVSFDASEALKIPGVVAFFTAKDIPGRNTFTPLELPAQESEEEILATKKISYYGQPVALIVAVDQTLAVQASSLVKVAYKKSKAKPVLSVTDALKSPDKAKRIREDANVTATDRGTDITKVLKGNFYVPDQYHYTLETQSCTVSNTRRGLVVRSATQWMDAVQVAVAKSLNMPSNSITVEVSRVGGAYGGKASRSALVACACALVAHKLNKTASLVMPLTHNMAVIGKRNPCYTDYEIGINNEGVIQYVDLSYYSDCGCSYNDTSAGNIAGFMANLYDTSRWSIKGYGVLTDKSSNTWCRSPGTAEATAIAEHIMERITFAVQQDSLDIRMQNISSNNNAMKDMIDTFKFEINYDSRKVEIEKYNQENAWKKKALKITLMAYPIEYYGNFSVSISVYHADGTVLISHGGIEMGQGINTKIAQVCAHALKIPMDLVKVKGADSFVSPNAMGSSGSISSESVAFATVKACDELMQRLEPLRRELDEPTWLNIIHKAYGAGVNLQVYAMTSQLDSLQNYSVYGICAAETWLDVLTGNHVVVQVELNEDTGQSLSPAIDVGQIEGAFIMGLGLWTSERLVYAPSGRLLTDRTWTYKPPGANDIPEDFRVVFRRNSYNNKGVLRSKATGEPALVLAVAVAFALHDCIYEARKEYGHSDTEWVRIDAPYCVENIIKGMSPNIESYKL
ncbi:uncharacterized protein LOC126980172 isoform X2 [Leptidea sinapis]|nr:uncharacterized protein LOC126980172 isoform X2 [Leptidea sinapis]